MIRRGGGPRIDPREGKNLLLAFDFDGTLSPLADHPNQARLSSSARRHLRVLAQCHRVVVLSGRALKDVRYKVGIPSIVYGGNHGVEISGPGVRYVNTLALKLKKQAMGLQALVREQIGGLPGVHMEPKGFGLAIHYRLLVRGKKKEFERRLALLKKRTHGFLFHWTQGHKVWEIRPRTGWNKGKALRFLQERWKASRVVCVGDDVTDEDMFRAVRGRGVSIKVGPGKTLANYRWSDQRRVETHMSQWAKNCAQRGRNGVPLKKVRKKKPARPRGGEPPGGGGKRTGRGRPENFVPARPGTPAVGKARRR